MSKLIETTFSLGGYNSIKQGRRILIVHNQSGLARAANLILGKTGNHFVPEQNDDPTKAHLRSSLSLRREWR